jgi:riboflavin kinase
LETQPKITGVVFSDSGEASSFMAMEWVQRALRTALGFTPYPATLNLRPANEVDAGVWRTVQQEFKGIEVPPTDSGFCSAQLFRVRITKLPPTRAEAVDGAVLLPQVANYPQNKIEIVAPVRLKDAFGVEDGDHLILEFIH